MTTITDCGNEESIIENNFYFYKGETSLFYFPVGAYSGIDLSILYKCARSFICFDSDVLTCYIKYHKREGDYFMIGLTKTIVELHEHDVKWAKNAAQTILFLRDKIAKFLILKAYLFWPPNGGDVLD